MRPITYLASYPRSGNTFLRALLANYFSRADVALSTQQIAHFGFGEHDEPLMRRCSGVEGEWRTVEDEWLARRSYFNATRLMEGEGAVLFKTHTLNGSAFGEPAFRFEPADRIVYVVRHPLDVAVSGAAFFGIDQKQMAARILLPGATNQSDGRHFEITGSWREHVGGWLNETRVPIHLIRYEDLRSHPAAQLRRLLRFMDQPVEHERVHRAIRHASFSHLKQSQQTEGFYQGPARDPRATFFREGKAGGWRRALDPALAAHLSHSLQDLMRMFGYQRAKAA
jgi:hypothetical protein